MKKMFLLFTAIAVSALASAKTYNVTLFQPTTVAGAELKPGDYKIDVNDNKAVIRQGKTKVETDVATETSHEKFGSTSVRYENGDGKYRIKEIRLGGTKTKLVFN
jgi:hypothetical protein